MTLPNSFLSVTVADNTLKNNGNAETGAFRVAVTTISAANYVAVTGALSTLKIAIQGITLGRFVREVIESGVVQIANTPASDPLAQRENKWLCRYHGDTLGQKFSVSLPTADVSLHMTNSEFLDLSGGVGGTFKSAFEAVVKSPNDASETVTLDSVQFVGRNT